MFLCGDCLTKDFMNSADPVSRGRCESCDQVRDCSDIPSGRLVRKPENLKCPYCSLEIPDWWEPRHMAAHISHQHDFKTKGTIGEEPGLMLSFQGEGTLTEQIRSGKHGLSPDQASPVPETVNHPQHYGGDTTYEAIKVIEAWGLGFHLGNAAKYVCRAGRKDGVSHVEDLKKAIWYIQRAIDTSPKL